MAVKLVKGQCIASYKCTYWWYWWDWGFAWHTKGSAGSGMQWVSFPAALCQSRWDCSNLMGVLTKRILELMNGDKLPFPQITGICCVSVFGFWVFSIHQNPFGLWWCCLLQAGNVSYSMGCLEHTGSSQRSCVVQGLRHEEIGQLYRCQWAVAHGASGSYPVTCTAALGKSSQGYSEKENVVEGNWRFYGSGCRSVWSLGGGVSN